MLYHNPGPISKEEALEAFEAEDKTRICEALVSIAFHEADWHWAQEVCLRFLLDETESLHIRGVAATCLGHLARIHRTLDKERVVAALSRFLQVPALKGQAQDALDDIEIFTR